MCLNSFTDRPYYPYEEKVSIMFKVGEKVLYSLNGVCEITDITEKYFGNTKIKYYVLKPIYNDKSTLFVPVENKNLVSKMKRLCTKEQIDEILQNISMQSVEWNSNDIARRDEYKNVISRGEIKEILVLLKQIWLRRREQIAKGRKLHISDEMYMREAEKMIKEEMSVVIEVEQEDVIPYIKNKLLV